MTRKSFSMTFFSCMSTRRKRKRYGGCRSRKILSIPILTRWISLLSERTTSSSAMREKNKEMKKMHTNKLNEHGSGADKYKAGAVAVGAGALGAIALGSAAFGAMAIGALALGRLMIRKAYIKELRVGTL